MANSTLISSDELRNVFTMVHPLIIKIIVAVVILLIGVVIGKVIEKIISRILELIELDKLTRKKFGMTFSKVISRAALYFIIIFSLVLALNKVGVTTALVNTIILVIAVIFVLFILIGANDIFANFFAGVVILFKKNFRVGDVIKIKDKTKNISGTIAEINLLSMRVETGKDESVFIPNVVLFKSQVIKVRKKVE
jgi:small conductance mechanosensitive channel